MTLTNKLFKQFIHCKCLYSKKKKKNHKYNDKRQLLILINVHFKYQIQIHELFTLIPNGIVHRLLYFLM
jgi:hypothetical protein